MRKANTHALWWWTRVGVSTFAKEVEFLGLRGVWVPRVERDSALLRKISVYFLLRRWEI